MSSFQSNLDLISSWLSSHFLQINSSKSNTFSFLTNLSPTLTLSPTLPYPGLLLSVSPLFATLASSSLLLFHGLLTSLLSASNPIKSLACYSDTFLLTLLLQLSLNSTFLLSAQSLNTGVSSGTLLLLPSLNPLTLSNTLLLKLLPNSALRSFLLYILSTFNLPSLTSLRQKAKLIFLFKLLHHYIYFPSQISHPTLPPSYPL